MRFSKKLNIIGISSFFIGLYFVISTYFFEYNYGLYSLYFGLALIALSLLAELFKKIRRIYKRKRRVKQKHLSHRISYQAITLIPLSDTKGYVKKESVVPLKREEKHDDNRKRYQTYTIAPKSNKKRRRKKHRK